MCLLHDNDMAFYLPIVATLSTIMTLIIMLVVFVDLHGTTETKTTWPERRALRRYYDSFGSEGEVDPTAPREVLLVRYQKRDDDSEHKQIAVEALVHASQSPQESVTTSSSHRSPQQGNVKRLIY